MTSEKDGDNFFRHGGEITPEDRALYPRRKLHGCYVLKTATFI
jgi:hypothetical protein